MKIIVLKEFYDREAGMILRAPGEVCEADEKRAAFLVTRGLAEEAKEEAKEKEKEKEPEKEETKKEASKTPAKRTRKKAAPEE